jgi:methylation protein EvaC
VEEANLGVVAGWAASAKSATLLNWCGIGPDLVQYVVDTTPAKFGRYTPGTHIPIVGPDAPDPDTFLLLAHNYVARIRHDPFKGRWLVPIPYPVVL